MRWSGRKGGAGEKAKEPWDTRRGRQRPHSPPRSQGSGSARCESNWHNARVCSSTPVEPVARCTTMTDTAYSTRRAQRSSEVETKKKKKSRTNMKHPLQRKLAIPGQRPRRGRPVRNRATDRGRGRDTGASADCPLAGPEDDLPTGWPAQEARKRFLTPFCVKS